MTTDERFIRINELLDEEADDQILDDSLSILGDLCQHLANIAIEQDRRIEYLETVCKIHKT